MTWVLRNRWSLKDVKVAVRCCIGQRNFLSEDNWIEAIKRKTVSIIDLIFFLDPTTKIRALSWLSYDMTHSWYFGVAHGQHSNILSVLTCIPMPGFEPRTSAMWGIDGESFWEKLLSCICLCYIITKFVEIYFFFGIFCTHWSLYYLFTLFQVLICLILTNLHIGLELALENYCFIIFIGCRNENVFWIWASL